MELLTRRSVRFWIVAASLVAMMGLLLARPGSRAAENHLFASAADDPPSEGKQPTLKVSQIPASTLTVPAKGTAKDYLRFIHKVESLQPEFENETEAEKFLTTSRNSILEAADKLLASKPDSEQETTALRSKLDAYRVLMMVGVPNTLPAALKFADQLRHDPRPELADMGTQVWLDFRMSTIPNADAKERLAVIDAVADELRKKPRNYLEFAQQVGRMLEIFGDGKSAEAAYNKFGEILAKNLDDKIREFGEKMKVGSVRRVRLLSGDPLKISGTTTDGKPFDLSQYKGKVVVVDFWATWCGPCLEELPNIKAVYNKYHQKGLEVVGISLDDNKDELDRFLKQNDIPWKVLNSSDATKKGFEDTNADYYGISGIPAIFLMNREGKVISLAARGERLGELVSSLMDGHAATSK